MLAKVTAKNQLTLPKSVTAAVGAAEYFEVEAREGRIILTPVRIQRAGGRVLILWRTLGNDAKADNAALERYLAKIAVNPADTEYDFIYVNGSHTLPDPHNKIHLIEEELQRRMFESDTFERLSND